MTGRASKHLTFTHLEVSVFLDSVTQFGVNDFRDVGNNSGPNIYAFADEQM